MIGPACSVDLLRGSHHACQIVARKKLVNDGPHFRWKIVKGRYGVAAHQAFSRYITLASNKDRISGVIPTAVYATQRYFVFVYCSTTDEGCCTIDAGVVIMKVRRSYLRRKF